MCTKEQLIFHFSDERSELWDKVVANLGRGRKGEKKFFKLFLTVERNLDCQGGEGGGGGQGDHEQAAQVSQVKKKRK